MNFLKKTLIKILPTILLSTVSLYIDYTFIHFFFIETCFLDNSHIPEIFLDHYSSSESGSEDSEEGSNSDSSFERSGSSESELDGNQDKEKITININIIPPLEDSLVNEVPSARRAFFVMRHRFNLRYVSIQDVRFTRNRLEWLKTHPERFRQEEHAAFILAREHCRHWIKVFRDRNSI